MSRRIIFAAVAATAALIATQAIADRECPEDTCRVPEAAEPHAQAAPEPEEPEADERQAARARPEPVRSAPQPSEVPGLMPPEITVAAISEPAKPAVPPAAEARADARLAPGSVLHKVATDPAPPRAVAEPAPRQTAPRVVLGAAETRKPVAVPPLPARPVNVVVPAYVRPERPPQAAYILPAAPTTRAQYVVRERSSIATAAVVEVPGEIQTGDGLVTVYPNLRHDPAWKLCQIDSRDLGRRSYRCTAYSYHPYGEGGYRPYGVYRSYPAAPGYVVAPNAKIISIDTND